MGELINGRTPEEIITGLKCEVPCSKCAYKEHNFMKDDSCSYYVEQDIIALINHLESQQPTWISVKDRLPEEIDQVCIAYMPHYHEYIIAEYAGCGEWVDKADLCNVTRLVTHWMPLPEPPKEER